MPRKNVRPIPDQLLTIREVADRLNVNLWTLRRLTDSGRLRAYRVGVRSDRRYSVRDVDKYMTRDASENPERGNEGRLLSLQEASLRIGVHRNTLRRWADIGELKAERIGSLGERQFDEQQLERYLKSRRSP